MKPLIGLTAKLAGTNGDAHYKLDRHYIESIVAAGGEPFILPFVTTREDASRWLDRVAGIVLTGGPDLNPGRWSEPLHPKTELMHSDKEASDLHFAAEAFRRDVPLLGICLGCQEMNVALGGSLHQHVEGHEGGREHPVEVTGSRLADLVGRAPKVNSYHHQSINRLGTGLTITASADGVVEAVESEKHRFALGVQWHPERISSRPEQHQLFRAFVAETARS
jgi:putative glutamine amidotransferase